MIEQKTVKNEPTKNGKGWNYLAYALYAFAGLGIEVLI